MRIESRGHHAKRIGVPQIEELAVKPKGVLGSSDVRQTQAVLTEEIAEARLLEPRNAPVGHDDQPLGSELRRRGWQRSRQPLIGDRGTNPLRSGQLDDRGSVPQVRTQPTDDTRAKSVGIFSRVHHQQCQPVSRPYRTRRNQFRYRPGTEHREPKRVDRVDAPPKERQKRQHPQRHPSPHPSVPCFKQAEIAGTF
jgi:hypothetical protein